LRDPIFIEIVQPGSHGGAGRQVMQKQELFSLLLIVLVSTGFVLVLPPLNQLKRWRKNDHHWESMMMMMMDEGRDC